MYTSQLLLIPAFMIATASKVPDGLGEWLFILVVVIFGLNQVLDFHKKHIKQSPDSSKVDTDLRLTKQSLESRMQSLEDTVDSGFEQVEDSFSGGLDKIETEFELRLERLRKNMDDRFTAATRSRKEIHKDFDLFRERMAKTETEVENLKQRDALAKIAGSK